MQKRAGIPRPLLFARVASVSPSWLVVGDGCLVDRHRFLGDLLPAELVDAALASGQTHLAGPITVAGQLVESIGEGPLEVCDVVGVLCLRRVVGHQQPGLAVHDHLGDAAHRGRDHRDLAGHGLQVHDAQRLVDRRAREHRGVGQHLTHRSPRQHLLHPLHARCAGRSTHRRPCRTRPRSPGCPARRPAAAPGCRDPASGRPAPGAPSPSAG